MTRNNDDIEQGSSPITPPEGDIEEQETIAEPEPVPVSPTGSQWNWVGSPDRPEAQKVSDGISDLFEVPTDDDTKDLISVDIEKDILDAGPEGDLSELVEVSEDDILGDEETGQVPLEYKPDEPRRRALPRYQRTRSRYVPPTSLGGIGG